MPPEMSKFQQMIEAAKMNLPKPTQESVKPKDTSKIKELKRKLAELPSEIKTKSGVKINELIAAKKVESEKRKSTSESRKRESGRTERSKERQPSPPRKPKALSYEQLMKIAKTTTVEGLIKPVEKKDAKDKSKDSKDRTSEWEKDRRPHSADRDRYTYSSDQDRFTHSSGKDRYSQPSDSNRDRYSSERDRYTHSSDRNRISERPVGRLSDRPSERYISDRNQDRLSSLVVPQSRVQSKGGTASRKKGLKNPPPELIKLQKQKRDLATIEEVQNEIARKKGKPEPVRERKDDRYMNSDNRARHEIRDRYDSKYAGSELKKSISKESLKKSGSRDKLNKKPVYSDGESGYEYSRKRQYYSDEDDYDYPKKRKHDLTNESYVDRNVSSIIGDMFGYNRNKYRDEYSDDSSDMEAGYEDVLREEKRSLKIGKKEDLEEEMRQEREKRKHKR
ncbi:hypothetical protein HDV01_004317 [Terramyces sp. JEL0728]|nr:hypothetical protein HDV01_004317 [Terramyces sp. JEL0728]